MNRSLLAISRRSILSTPLMGALALAWLLVLCITPAVRAGSQQQAACSGYEYQVQPGDSWSSLAARTGLSISLLQAANPQAVRANQWLYAGQRLCISDLAHAGAARSSGGSWYTVQPGDTWSGLAARSGVSVATLQLANPQALRSRQWLFAGERIWIPEAGGRPMAASAATSGRVAAPASAPAAAQADAATEQPAAEQETAAAPASQPAQDATPAAPAEAGAAAKPEQPAAGQEAAAAPAGQPSQGAAPAEAGAAAASEQPAAGQAGAATPTPLGRPSRPSPTPRATATPVPLPAWAIRTPTAPAASSASQAPIPEALRGPCLDNAEAYGPASAAVLTAYRGETAALEGFLAGCQVLSEDRGMVETIPLDDEGPTAVLVVAADPAAGDQQPEGILALLTEGEAGWQVAYQAGVAAGVSFIKKDDLNDDGNPEVAWSDTTCGAHSCFTTAHILSYVDGQFSDWIDGDTTMAGAEIAFSDVITAGSGLELVMTGGVIGSGGAGPQRAITATWASLGGAPYTLAGQDYALSDCLYHQVLDANAALLAGGDDNLAAAIAGYRRAADDGTLVACWVRPGEEEELRAFALYRLAVAQAYAGDLDAAADVVSELAATYPEDSYTQAAELWWAAYEPTQDGAATCAAVAVFVQENPDTWERLADYGYANPSFAAQDVCPVAPQQG